MINDEQRITTLTDEECLTEFISYLRNRVDIGTTFLNNKESGLITHLMINIRCGEFTAESEPEELPIPFMIPSISRDTNITVN